MSGLFENFNKYRFLEFLESETAQGLQDILAQIRHPFLLKTIYFDGKKHIAWILSSRKIKKVEPPKKKLKEQ